MCINNDVKINATDYPFVYWNDEWLPFCREYLRFGGSDLWDEICKKMDYTSGRLLDERNSTSQQIERCYNGENAVSIKKEGFAAKLECFGENNTKRISSLLITVG